MRHLLTLFSLCLCVAVNAQPGNFRNELSVGVGGGWVMSNVGFSPRVPQSMHQGFMGGVAVKYLTEKYFSTYCSIVAELNYARLGWKENIRTETKEAVINPVSNLPEEYSRHIDYLQLPVFAHLAWGKAENGFQFFFRAGPQLGLYLKENTTTNFTVENRNIEARSNNIVAQDSMQVENKLDYGIAAGIGLEYARNHVGHFLLEARYYYGLGNIYGDSKKDFFGRSNFGNIVIKLTYLFDVVKKKNKN